MKTKQIMIASMRIAALLMGITIPIIDMKIVKLGIFAVILLFLILDTDNKRSVFRVSSLFVLGAIIGFLLR